MTSVLFIKNGSNMRERPTLQGLVDLFPETFERLLFSFAIDERHMDVKDA
jgi:hypothetical protein